MEEYIRSKAANIISTLEHLLPHETSKQELKIIQFSTIEIKKSEKGKLNFEIVLFIPEHEYMEVKEELQEIEKNI